VTRRHRAPVLALLLLAGIGLGSAGIWLAGQGAHPAASVRDPIGQATPSQASGSARPARYLLVIDFLAYAGEAVASDPIAGSPDAEELIAIIGDPTAFGSAVTDQAGGDVDASSRCGFVERTAVEALATALNGRLPKDQQIDPTAAESRALLHWDAAEGFASVRVFAQDRAASPSCADAGKRF
jgi:hypothetical protein